MIDGVVLAGGRSRRMGSDKALVEIDGVPMFVRAARTLVDGGCSEIAVISHLSLPADASISARWSDAHGGQGPLDGLITALRKVEGTSVCVLAVDLPRVSPGSILGMREAVMENEQLDVAYLSSSSGVQVLAACWRTRVLDSAESFFESGGRSIHDFARSLTTKSLIVEDHELLNVNSPSQIPSPAGE